MPLLLSLLRKRAKGCEIYGTGSGLTLGIIIIKTRLQASKGLLWIKCKDMPRLVVKTKIAYIISLASSF
ncbi:hypothetical protein LguiA_002460 [Lonicera macranthoides]